jgi:hypothetical protein
MSDFVEPEAERLTLGDGQFIDVKKKLNHGEWEDMLADMSLDGKPGVDGKPGEPTRLDRRNFRTVKVMAYLLGWSLMHNGKPQPYSPAMSADERRDIIRSLSPERFEEMYKAITAHEDGVAAPKKKPDGATESPVISPSPSDAAGGMSGFVN